MPKTRKNASPPFGAEGESYIANGNTWESATVNVRLSGRGNYILAKLRLLNPNSPKTLLAKEILEKALIEVDEKITGL
ncbi:TPA: hypothetical protein ACJG25_004114 [Salmonella enterica subsp. enterica serovar Saintpaul]